MKLSVFNLKKTSSPTHIDKIIFLLIDNNHNNNLCGNVYNFFIILYIV